MQGQSTMAAYEGRQGLQKMIEADKARGKPPLDISLIHAMWPVGFEGILPNSLLPILYRCYRSSSLNLYLVRSVIDLPLGSKIIFNGSGLHTHISRDFVK